MIELRSGRASCTVAPAHGARLAQLTIDDHPMLVDRHDDSLGWGCYPMVPYAGRVRNGQLSFHGQLHELPRRLPPHAIHGTVFEKEWTLEESSTRHCRLVTDLAPGWPFGGTVVHDVELHDDRLTMRLAVTATADMPVQIGWHPWFRKPADRRLGFAASFRRDHDGIALPERVHPAALGPDGTNDDCFADPDGVLRITVDHHDLVLSSSCPYWVVYDQPPSATCVEPQSGPPNGINDDPYVLPAGRTLTHEFTIAWSAHADHAERATRSGQ